MFRVTFLLLASTLHAADNWPEFRGPTGDGRSTAKNLPTKWSETENVAWKVPVHDKGWSSPVVWGKQVWLTTATAKGDKCFAMAFDTKTGKVVHDLLVFTVNKPDPADPYHVWAGYNSYASPTPAIEEGRIYVHYGVVGTACLDTTTGKKLWERTDLPCNHFRGAASSPVIVGDLVILTFDGFDLQYLVALSKKTGEPVWKRDRKFQDEKANGDGKKAYSTPLVIEVAGKKQLISPSAAATAAYDPATGEEIWRVQHGGMNASLRPLFGHGLVFTASSDGGKGLVAVKPHGKGDVTKTHSAWAYNKGAPNRSSFLLVGDHLYMVNSGGIASCVSVKDGKEENKTRLESKAGKFTASPVEAAGKWYVFDEEGLGFVVAADPFLDLVATNKLDAGCKGSPAVAGEAMYVRTTTHLYKIAAR